MPDTSQRTGQGSVTALARRLAGRPGDWQLRRPVIRAPRPSRSWFGSLLVVVSLAVSWFAFAGAVGEDGDASFALFVSAASILLMAWSFVLAVRISLLESLFGGLDRMYRIHRWCGTLAVVAMFLHTSSDPDVEQGIRGASKATANSAESLAGTGEVMLYILVAISILRWFPYRYWRWTHKLLGVPFAFACFHFFTAEKPYANGSAWGWWFGFFMVAGLVAWIVRVVGRDVLAPGTPYRVVATDLVGSTLDLRLAPTGKPLQFVAGQFAALKVQHRGLREPHIFTIAAAPSESELRFFIRDLGDWTAKMQHADLVGTKVIVEGPYDRFEPTGDGRPTVWIAGGVGITPFLSASASLEPQPDGSRPVLLCSVSDRDDAMALEYLEQAQQDGIIDLLVLASAEGNRFDDSTLMQRFGERGLTGAHVAVCGPAGLVAAAERAARALGATTIEREDFDIRQGFGPDLSADIERVTSRATKRT